MRSRSALIVAITVAILVGLFAIQRHGTGAIGRLFGPVMVVWFVTIGVLGLAQIVAAPGRAARAVAGLRRRVLRAQRLARLSDPRRRRPVPDRRRGAVRRHGALRRAADPGRVVRARDAGARAVLLRSGRADARTIRARSANPFFALVPVGIWTYALVVLSTLATIIASQALISGVFSLTHQAIQLGLFPRVDDPAHLGGTPRARSTCRRSTGASRSRAVCSCSCFQESSKLAAAYGIAVSGTMAITSVAYYLVTRRTWGWPRWKALPLLVLFLSFDLPFFAANLMKFVDGGYVPILVGAVFFVVMMMWRLGRTALTDVHPGALDAAGRVPRDDRSARRHPRPRHRDLPDLARHRHPADPRAPHRAHPRAPRARRAADDRVRPRAVRPGGRARRGHRARQGLRRG